MSESTVDNEIIKLWIEGGIMYAKYKVENLTQEKAQQMIKSRLALCKGNPYPFCADVTKVLAIDREARNEFSQGKGIELMPACALVVNSPVNRILGNFFMFVNKPTIPTRLFNSTKEASDWLRKFK